MDPRKLFADKRFNVCAYCGGPPSKVLLDKPPDLQVVWACEACNNSLSPDEAYAACFVECALAGSVDPQLVHRPRVRQLLLESKWIRDEPATEMERAASGDVLWHPNRSRIMNVVLKLARGHVAYQDSETMLEAPTAA